MASKKTTNETASQKSPKKRSSAAKKAAQRTDDELTSLDNQVNGVISNIEMLYNTIKELRDREMYHKIPKLNIAQDENFARLEMLDKEKAQEIRNKYQTDDKGVVLSSKGVSSRNREVARISHPLDDTDGFLNMFRQTQEDSTEYNIVESKPLEVETFSDISVDDIDEVYDVLSLPSNGQCYKHKKNKVAVSYLTATDENFITSPNLYRDGLITDCLLHRKIVDKTFNVNDLVAGDADAILYFLRVSSYGAEFPATFTDPETNQSFETIIDLGQIKSKNFTLEGDENGYFDFELPVTKDKIKFRFLTKKDERKLEKMNQMGDNADKAIDLRNIIKYLDAFLEDNKIEIDDNELYQIQDSMDALENVSKRIEEKEGLPINRIITNRLEMSIVSVNGNTDKQFIKKYVRTMIAKDSLTLRRYILENTPGLDFSIKIERPESLGGGFIDTFLEWDDTIFLNIT